MRSDKIQLMCYCVKIEVQNKQKTSFITITQITTINSRCASFISLTFYCVKTQDDICLHVYDTILQLTLTFNKFLHFVHVYQWIQFLFTNELLCTVFMVQRIKMKREIIKLVDSETEFRTENSYRNYGLLPHYVSICVQHQ